MTFRYRGTQPVRAHVRGVGGRETGGWAGGRTGG